MRTKRAFFIVIAVLVILDIAAAFWYVAGRLNNDDEATNPFDTEKAVGDSTISSATPTSTTCNSSANAGARASAASNDLVLQENVTPAVQHQDDGECRGCKNVSFKASAF